MSQDAVPERIYLDNAATSWPKPEPVYAAVDRAMRQLGAPAGRSGYAEAVEVTQAVEVTRFRLARLFGLSDPTHLIFACNGTDALNLAIHGLLREGDHVVTSVVEHNSVLRPLGELEAQGRISVTRVGCDAEGLVDPADVRAALRGATRLIAISHASNVTGAIQPVEEIGQLTRQSGALLLCDAAQTAGHLPLNMAALDVDLLATSGHKGLLGPLGTGLLAIRPAVAEQLHSVRQGGTGTLSQQTRQPTELPAKFESGNLNVPSILGLGAAIEWLDRRGLAETERVGRELTARLIEGLITIRGLRVVGPRAAERRVPLVSVVVEGYDPQELALTLDAVFRIQVRAGLHCAPLMHRALGTDRAGGTLRFSLGPFTTPPQIDTTIRALEKIASTA